MNRKSRKKINDASLAETATTNAANNQSVKSMFQRQTTRLERCSEVGNAKAEDTKSTKTTKEGSVSKLSLRYGKNLRSRSTDVQYRSELVGESSPVVATFDEMHEIIDEENERGGKLSHSAGDVSEKLVGHRKRLPSDDAGDNPSAAKRRESPAGEDDADTPCDPAPEESHDDVPYYLRNFLLVLKVVLSDDLHDELFNEADQWTIDAFHNLGDGAKRLYVRLFQRQFRWIRKVKVIYPEIADDLSCTFNELDAAGLVINESELTDLEATLAALPSPAVKQLAASLKLQGCGTQRAQLADAILKHSRRRNLTAFFAVGGGAHGGTAAMILKKAKTLLGACFKLSEEKRAVFMRILMLFSLHVADDDSKQLALYQMLMSNAGHIKYPSYCVLRSTKIFSDRECLLRYSESLQLEYADLRPAMENKDYERAQSIYMAAKSTADAILNDPEALRWDRALPQFLRGFTAGGVYCRVLTVAVDLAEHRRGYEEAVGLLRGLLGQQTYLADHRGLWYDRLALDLDHHLGRRDEALDVIHEALADGRVRAGRRYSLLQRASKICHSAAARKLSKGRWVQFMDDAMNRVAEVAKVTIRCRRPACALPGSGPVYISLASPRDGHDITLLTRVEDAALEHYRSVGYPSGLHGEGGTFRYLFALFFWDILFSDGVPDVFYNAYQAAPLDLYSDHFFESRREQIEERLQCIMDSEPKDLESMLATSLDAHRETSCVGVDWRLFADEEDVKSLVRCLGGRALAGVMERFARDMRHTRSGLPDLVVWNSETTALKVVEVKGPGDRLSSKQILWLDYMQRLGLDTEVCHVQAIGAKKLA